MAPQLLLMQCFSWWRRVLQISILKKVRFLAQIIALQCIGFPWAPAAKATPLQELAGCFRRRLWPDAQNRAFAKNGNCIQSLDTALTTYTWKLFLASLDVDSLVTNIPLEKTINICVDNLHNDNKNPPNIPKHDFYNFLNIATKETFFMFNNKYKQVDGVAMESLLGPAVDNIFMCSFESK